MCGSERVRRAGESRKESKERARGERKGIGVQGSGEEKDGTGRREGKKGKFRKGKAGRKERKARVGKEGKGGQDWRGEGQNKVDGKGRRGQGRKEGKGREARSGVWAWRVNEENPREELKPIDLQSGWRGRGRAG